MIFSFLKMYFFNVPTQVLHVIFPMLATKRKSPVCAPAPRSVSSRLPPGVRVARAALGSLYLQGMCWNIFVELSLQRNGSKQFSMVTQLAF